MKRLLYSFVLAAIALSTTASAANYCGDLKNHYGPYDYRMRGTFDLDVVERAHFTPDIEAGIKGNTSYLGEDLNYTLRAIPNHPRALNTLVNLALRKKTVRVDHMKFPVECYFNRALRFVPDDGSVKAIYGNYLFSVGRKDEALTMLRAAVDLLPQDAIINYNLGLLYFEKKDYTNALRHANVAYQMGFPLPGLKDKLIKVGKWDAPSK